MAVTLYWHDYETFGVDPKRDRPAQRMEGRLPVGETPAAAARRIRW